MPLGETSTFARLASQYGPFFFSILFCVVLTRWGYSIYNNANKRKDPPAHPKEIDTYRFYFMSTVVFGFILVIISVVWYFMQQNIIHVFEGKICYLGEEHEFVSSDLFFKRKLVGSFGETDPIKYYDWEFFSKQSKPFDENKSFILIHSKTGGRTVEEAEIKYSPSQDLKYKLEFDEEANRNVLKLVRNHRSASAWSTMLYAAPYQQKQVFFHKSDEKKHDLSTDEIIGILQEERSDLGKKIEAIDRLFKMENSIPWPDFEKIITIVTPREPFILTLLDLSRHSDRELSYKARNLIESRFNVERYLLDGVMSDSQIQHGTMELILFRIERERLNRLLGKISSNDQNQFYRRIKNLVQSGHKSRVLVPTASTNGDRYYVMAKWDKNNGATVQCLTNLFHRELIHNRTLSQESEIMKLKQSRIIWWYSKKWALSMAEKIDECGGRSAFYSPVFSKK